MEIFVAILGHSQLLIKDYVIKHTVLVWVEAGGNGKVIGEGFRWENIAQVTNGGSLLLHLL